MSSTFDVLLCIAAVPVSLSRYPHSLDTLTLSILSLSRYSHSLNTLTLSILSLSILSTVAVFPRTCRRVLPLVLSRALRGDVVCLPASLDWRQRPAVDRPAVRCYPGLAIPAVTAGTRIYPSHQRSSSESAVGSVGCACSSSIWY